MFVGLLNVCAFMGWQMLLTGLPVHLSQLDATGAEIGLLSTVAMAGSIICRPFFGVMVDRCGRVGFLIGSLAMVALCYFGYALFPLAGIAILAAIIFVSGGRERINAYHVRQHQ